MTPDFERLLDASPNPYVLLDRDLSIVWANKEYLKVTMRDLEEISGKNLFEAFPSEGESYRQLRASLDRVRETGEIDEIAHIRYDIPDQHGSFDTHFWSATHTPIVDENGKVDLILQHTVDQRRRRGRVIGRVAIRHDIDIGIDVFEHPADDRALGFPEDQALADHVVDFVEAELPPQDAMIAAFGFLELLEVCFEFLFVPESRGVKSLQLLA